MSDNTGDTSKEGDDGGGIRDGGLRKQKTNSKQEKWSKTSLKRTIHSASSSKNRKLNGANRQAALKRERGEDRERREERRMRKMCASTVTHLLDPLYSLLLFPLTITSHILNFINLPPISCIPYLSCPNLHIKIPTVLEMHLLQFHLPAQP